MSGERANERPDATSPDATSPGATSPDVVGDVDVGLLAALTDPVRRTAYRIVAAAGEPIGRDDVARAAGIGRTLAAHHLDKLVAAGLLEVSYARRSGRSGPGAGRPAKLYRRAPGERSVSVPPRAYRSVAALLAEAVERAGVDGVLYEVAAEHGRALARTAAGRGAPVSSAASSVAALLASRGYEPHLRGDALVLRNCPFHTLAEEFPPLVCGMNLALIDGLLDGLLDGLRAGASAAPGGPARAGGWCARLDPEPGRCCVVVDLPPAEPAATESSPEGPARD